MPDERIGEDQPSAVGAGTVVLLGLGIAAGVMALIGKSERRTGKIAKFRAHQARQKHLRKKYLGVK